EETRWLQSLQKENTDLATFIRGAMPSLYFKTLQDLDDLVEWRNRLGIASRETSRQVLTTVLEQLRRVSLTGSRSVKLQDAPPTSAETLRRLLERWLPDGANGPGTRDSLMLQSVLSANRRVNSHLPIAYPDWPPGIRPKIVAATQKIVRRLLRWYIDPIVSQQNEINFDLIQTLTILSQEVIWLRQRATEADRERQSTLEALQQAIDELRQAR
ncbi:MAG: hypothetical protein IAE81_24515, partial [Caldilineaceae bacterium]|nr:hypothetical protein [Caldilineaceae bacterium]